MKIKIIIFWFLLIILSLAFIASGITKILGFEMQIKNLISWGYPLWFRFPIGITELAIGFLIVFNKYRKSIISLIFIWTLIAVITHIQANQLSYIVTPIIFSLIAIVVKYLDIKKRK